jgi:hypothetical protein
VQVTIGDTGTLARAGQTFVVGALTLSVQSLLGPATGGGCDVPGYTSMSGFIAP